jgi:hypothetical protein
MKIKKFKGNLVKPGFKANPSLKRIAWILGMTADEGFSYQSPLHSLLVKNFLIFQA